MTLRKPSTGRQAQGYKAVRKPPNEKQGRKSGNSVLYDPDREHDYPLQIPRYERSLQLTPMQVRKLDVPLTPEQIKALKALQYRYWVSIVIGLQPDARPFFIQKDSGPYTTPPVVTTGINVNTPPFFSVEEFVNGVYRGLSESWGFATQYSIYEERVLWLPTVGDSYQFLYQSNSDKGYWVCEVKSLPKSGTYPDWLRDYLNSQSGDPVITYQCNCPDFARADYRYFSQFSLEVGQRDWGTTDAGCDRAQGCKHCYATRLYLFEAVDLPDSESYPTTPQL